MNRPVAGSLCWRGSRRAGIAILAISFAVGCAQLYWNNFIDEGDNIAVGSLISRGYVLYRDVFSHHFPFPYYWVAWVTTCTGGSITAWRLSLLLFQTGMFGLALWVTPFPVALGIAALIWRTIGYPYYGNLLIYPNFSGAALVPVFAVTLAAAGRYMVLRRSHLIIIGVCGAIAVLSDPLAVYAVVLSLGGLACSGVGIRKAMAAGCITTAVLALYGAHLLASGTLGAFVSDAIRFNAEVYSKYRPVVVVPYHQTLYAASTLLDLFDARWMRVSSAAARYTHPDRCIWTGFAYRFAVVVATMILLARRRFLAAIFVYATAAVLLGAMGEERFGAIPFILLALFAGAGCLTGEWQPAGAENHDAMATQSRARVRRIPGTLLSAARICTALLFGGLFLQGAESIAENRNQLSYAANYHRYEQRAEMFKRLSCNRSDVALVYYPSGPLLHVFSGMPPASPYLFMFPWIAEVGIAQVIRNLETRLAVVSIDLDGQIWGYRNSDFMGPLLVFLDTRYEQVAPGLYRSPLLGAQCPLMRRG